MLTPEKKEFTLKIFQEFIENDLSVRETARRYNIPFTTLRDRFKVLKGENYMLHKGGEYTIFNVIKEAIGKVPEHKRAECLQWFENNKQRLLSESYFDNAAGKKFISDAKIQRDSKQFCYLPFDLADSPFLYDE